MIFFSGIFRTLVKEVSLFVFFFFISSLSTFMSASSSSLKNYNVYSFYKNDLKNKWDDDEKVRWVKRKSVLLCLKPHHVFLRLCHSKKRDPCFFVKWIRFGLHFLFKKCIGQLLGWKTTSMTKSSQPTPCVHVAWRQDKMKRKWIWKGYANITKFENLCVASDMTHDTPKNNILY